MKPIVKKLVVGGSGIAAMTLVGLLLGRKDKSEETETNENEVVLDEDLVDSYTDSGDEETSEENSEE